MLLQINGEDKIDKGDWGSYFETPIALIVITVISGI